MTQQATRDGWLRTEDRPLVGAILREAVESLDETIENFPRQMADRLRPAQRAVARLRDDLNERLNGCDAGEAAALREVLGRVNICLSLLHGLKPPQGTGKQPPLNQARDILYQLFDEVAADRRAG
jgi:hypothetical protein